MSFVPNSAQWFEQMNRILDNGLPAVTPGVEGPDSPEAPTEVINPISEFDDTLRYQRGWAVAVAGIVYVANDIVPPGPFDTANFTKLIDLGNNEDDGIFEYSDTAAYRAGQPCKFKGALYVSKFTRTVGVWPAAPSANMFDKVSGSVAGEFNVAINYSVGDLVYYEGSIIKCAVDVVAYRSFNVGDWIFPDTGPFKGSYGPGVWKVGNICEYEGRLFKCKQEHGHPLFMSLFSLDNWSSLSSNSVDVIEVTDENYTLHHNPDSRDFILSDSILIFYPPTVEPLVGTRWTLFNSSPSTPMNPDDEFTLLGGITSIGPGQQRTLTYLGDSRYVLGH